MPDAGCWNSRLIGNWLLAAGYWLLLLTARYLTLITECGFWIPDIDSDYCQLLLLLPTGCWSLASSCLLMVTCG
jgi:hypothetical protein